MTDPDFNLLVALEALLAEESVAGAASGAQRIGNEPDANPPARCDRRSAAGQGGA